MGNTPAKEVKPPRSGSLSKDLLGSPKMLANFSKKRKDKEKEKQKQKEQHMLDLIVRAAESVDGGYLAPYGNYKFGLTYKTQVVRDLIVERKIAPFYTPLQDFDESWTDEELLKYLRALPLHAQISKEDLEEDEEDPDDHKIHQSVNSNRRREHKAFKRQLKETGIKLQQEVESRYERDKSVQISGIKTFEYIPSDDLLLRLYRNATECPICFLYHPPNLNLSRCCVQPICTECFVQMKRLDPHPPHDEESAPNSAPNDVKSPEDLISEPVKCPFCAMSDFGVTYTPPNFRTGLGGRAPRDFHDTNAVISEESDSGVDATFTPGHGHRTSLSYAISKSHSAQGTPPRRSGSFSDINALQGNSLSQLSSASDGNGTGTPVSSSNTGTTGQRTRRGSLPPTAPGVVTIDRIRPDWEQKLLNARAKLARRSAAATALHASSLLIDTNDGSRDTPGRHQSNASRSRRLESNRYSRDEQLDIEERMIEEALRLSLLEEEERKLKERMNSSKATN